MATQTCDRTITGRNFDYGQALSIIQDEEYLEDEDFDNIRFYRKHGNVLESIETAQEKYEPDADETHHRSKRTLISEFGDFSLFNTTCDGILCPLNRILITLGTFVANPPPPQQVPEQFPQPGTPGGGGRPTGNEGILTLVPAGLTAVAVFPPFSSIRRTPTEAVIFKEAQGTLPGVNTGRKKRQVGYGYCEPPSFLDRFLLNVRCLTPRLKARFARTTSPAHYGYGKKKRDTGFHEPECNQFCGSIEDCFDLLCPRYGFAVRYQFTRDGNESNRGQTDQIRARQTGEGFRSAAPPDCRTITS